MSPFQYFPEHKGILLRRRVRADGDVDFSGVLHGGVLPHVLPRPQRPHPVHQLRAGRLAHPQDRPAVLQALQEPPGRVHNRQSGDQEEVLGLLAVLRGPAGHSSVRDTLADLEGGAVVLFVRVEDEPMLQICG